MVPTPTSADGRPATCTTPCVWLLPAPALGAPAVAVKRLAPAPQLAEHVPQVDQRRLPVCEFEARASRAGRGDAVGQWQAGQVGQWPVETGASLKDPSGRAALLAQVVAQPGTQATSSERQAGLMGQKSWAEGAACRGGARHTTLPQKGAAAAEITTGGIAKRHKKAV